VERQLILKNKFLPSSYKGEIAVGVTKLLMLIDGSPDIGIVSVHFDCSLVLSQRLTCF